MAESSENKYTHYPTKEYYHKYYYDMKEVFDNCDRCSLCKWIDSWEVKHPRFAKVCPSISYFYFDAYSAQGRMDLGKAVLDGMLTYEDTDKIPHVFYTCNTCGGCDASCKRVQDMEPLRAMIDFRSKLVEDGQILPEHMPVMDSLKKNDNMMFGDKTLRGKWAEGLDVKDLTKDKAEYVFHAGCKVSFDEALFEVGRKAITVLKNAGVDVGIMGSDETCCGSRAHDMGYKGQFITYAQNNIDAWKNAGVKKVVTICSDGYYGMKRLYPELGANIEVVHMVEFVHRLVQKGKLKFTKSVPMNVTYHDPCHLGRRLAQAPGQYVPGKAVMGLYEEPREILRAIPGLQLTEMFRIKEYAWCCGSGGGVAEAYPEFSMRTAKERIEEAKAVGAQAIVTACPWCVRNFTEAIKENGEKMEVYDILDLVLEAS